MKRTLYLFALVSIAFSAIACSTEANQKPAVAASPKDAPIGQRTEDEGVAKLPYARGEIFYTLEEYLAHLEKQGAIDLPWWREIRPGVYERVVRMPEAAREVATREELMRRFGFER